MDDHALAPRPALDPAILAAALDLAVLVARQAGALLLADLHRPKGPRGHGSHADADTEVEHLIRGALTGRFPAFGYRGEETGEWNLDRRGTFWLVDPNDGTSAYLQGYRGSAVSIALIHGGLPVLGVVFAFAAPDDDGDLLAWAEGGLLTRNGLPVARAPLPDTLAPSTLLLLSHGHERFQRNSAEFAHPARFRCLPSAAYRLALVAAGDGDAALSTGGPTDWDVAAGHALLRAVGGELVGADGAPVRYGATFSGDMYGGSIVMASELARRGRVRWEGPPAPTTAGLGLVEPAAGLIVGDPGLLRRAQGCLLGQLAGDALGGLVEFDSAEEIARAYPAGVRDLADGGTWKTLAGQPTDDSEMALTLARCLVRDGRHDRDAVAEAYRAWVASGPFDLGGTTSAGLAGRWFLDSQANGSLMRIAPLALWGHRLPPEQLATLARAESAITHVHGACQDACAAFTFAIAHALRTGDAPRLVYGTTLSFARARGLEPSVLAALERAQQAPPEDFQQHMGWVLIALQNAFFRLLHAPSVEEGLVATVGCGGDTDTNGAIAGALLGAVHGREAIPVRWVRALLGCRPLQGIEGVHRPRPATFWPVDVLVLSERLLLAGGASAG